MGFTAAIAFRRTKKISQILRLVTENVLKSLVFLGANALNLQFILIKVIANFCVLSLRCWGQYLIESFHFSLLNEEGSVRVLSYMSEISI